MKHSDYLKRKKNRETRKKIVSVISAIIVFVTTYAMVLPAITLDVSTARQEPGFAYEQVQFKTTAAAASVTAADSTVEEVPVQTSASEEPEEDEVTETIEEEPAESSGEETPAVSDEQEDATDESEQTEEPDASGQEEAPAAVTEEEQEDKSEDSGSGAASSSESDSSKEQIADTQKAEENAAVDQSGTDAADEAETTADTAADFQIPQLDALDFDEILTDKTAFYYYHPENAEEAENLSSDSIDEWKKADADTVLAPEDFVRVYLSYEIPAGALNETNVAARYRLPAGLELSDKQIEAVNKYENGIAASMSGSDHDKYLGAEAIEGSRTPDEKADNEYISATVKAEKVYNDGSYAGQDLIFTFIPYTVEQNQIVYNEKGDVIAKGAEVKGFFTFDLTTAQIGFEKTDLETVENEDGSKEEIQYSKADIEFTKDIERTLTLAERTENEESQPAESEDDTETTAAEDKAPDDKEEEGKSAEDKEAENKAAEDEAAKTTLGAKKGGALRAGDGTERTVVATGSAGSSVTWTLYNDGEVVFSGSGAVSMSDGGSLAEYKDQVKKMTFADAITSISQSAFKDFANLKSVQLPASLTSIGSFAFQNCTNLESVDFKVVKDTLKSIGESAFESTGLTAIDLSGCSKLRTIGKYCFKECPSVEKIDLKDCTSLQTIEREAFSGEHPIQYIDLTNCRSLVTIGHYAFNNAKSSEFTGISFDGCTSLKTIGSDAFLNVNSGQELQLDLTPLTALEYIYANAFRRNRFVGTVSIPSSVKEVGVCVFVENNFDTVDLSQAGSLEKIGDMSFLYSSPRSVDFSGCTNLVAIGSRSFDSCITLSEIDLIKATKLKSIGTYAFNNCCNATYIAIPKSVTWIDETAFAKNGSVTRLLWNAENYRNVLNAGTFNQSNGFSSGFELVIGEDVNALPSGFFEAVSCGDVYFRPNSHIDMSADATKGAPVPISKIDGPCYVDEEGVVYEIEGEGAERYARVAYCPPGIDNYTVPTTIPFEGEQVPVKEIGNSAFVLARDLKEIKFEDASGITSVGNNAFYGVGTLETVTDLHTDTSKTTISDAISLFTETSAPRSAFLKTGLEDDTEPIWKDGNPVQSLTVDNAGVRIQIDPPAIGNGEAGYTWNQTEKRYEYYTGAYLNTNVSAANRGTEPVTARIYLNYSNDSYEGLRNSFTVGDENIQVDLKNTSDPDVKYLEFTLEEGKTLSFSLTTTYPSPNSSGGDLHIWIELPEEEDDDLNPLTPDSLTSDNDYMAASWTTLRQEKDARKTVDSQRAIQSDGTGHKYFLPTTDWYIRLPNTGETAKNAVGKDYCESVTYIDKLTLPEGFSWSSELLAALSEKKYGFNRVDRYTYFYIINEDHTTRAIGYVYIPPETSMLGVPTLTLVTDNDSRQNIEFSWKLKPTAGEFPTGDLVFRINAPFLTVDFDNYPAGGYTLTNHVDLRLDYAHSEDKDLETSASTKVYAGKANLVLDKTRASGKNRNYSITMGNKETFYLDVSNTGTLNSEELSKVTDSLNEYMYIQASDMERMFEEVYGDRLEITISDAQLFDAPERETAVGMDGSVVSITAANSDQDGPDSTQNTIVIKKGADNGYIISLNGTDHQCNSIQSGLDSVGYVVTYNAKYDVKWTFNSGNTADPAATDPFIVFGGMNFRLPIYVTHKNTFGMLHKDWPNYYDSPANSAKYDMTNTAFLGKTNGSKQAKSCIPYFLTKDVSFGKGASRNGTPVSDFSAVQFRDGDVIAYNLKTVNRGAKIQNLPLIDKMSGAQVMLVPVEGNVDVVWGESGLPEIYTDADGVQYYKLNRDGEYHSVRTSAGIIADTITVKEVNGGWTTDIKWYYSALSRGTSSSPITSTITYKALVISSNITFSLQNKAWLNDRVGDRLYAGLGGGGSAVLFNKQIVTKNPNYDGITDGEECDSDNNSALTREHHDSVYKLTLSASGSGEFTINGNEFFDRLPQTFGVFDWDRENVEITCRPSNEDLVETVGMDQWQITQESPNPEMWENNVPGQYYLTWPESTKITFKGKNGDKAPELYIYVKLHFTDEWSEYSSRANGVQLTNTLYVHGFPRIVTQDVLAEGNVVMQKGVYSISHMGETNSRVYFEKENSHVTYYVALYNGGPTRFYLNDIVDVLPAGFNVREFGQYTQNGTVGSETSPYITPVKSPDGYSDEKAAASLTLPQDEVVYKHASIYGSNNSQDQSFTIHFLETTESQMKNGFVGYDPVVGKVYLQPNEAVVFKYIANIDPNRADDESVNTNRISMDYYDPNSVGVTVNQDIAITAGNTSLDAEPNDGNCVVINKPEGGKRLVSEVSIRNGDILPGVSKSVTSYKQLGETKNIVFGQEAVVHPSTDLLWEVRTYNEGTKDINGYKIKDTMQYPYRFTGDVNYVIYDSENSTQVDAQPVHPNNQYAKPLFTIVRTNENDDGTGTVTIRDLMGGEHELVLGGNPVELSLPMIKLAYHGSRREDFWPLNSIYNVGKSGSVKVSLAIDPDTKDETMMVEFPENTMAIYPGCVGKLTVWTNPQSNNYANTTYVNTADLIPDDKNYESSLVTHGNPVFDNEGGNDYVENYGFVTTAIGYATSSRKHVTEKDKTSNTAHSYEPVNYITLSKKDNTFTYTLEVENPNDTTAFDSITLVDNLPDVGDGYTLRDDIKRNSQYKVNFADDPAVTVSVLYPDSSERTLEPSEFTVKYSDNQVLDFQRGQANDWNPDADTWQNELSESSRSVLVNIIDPSGTVMTGGSRIRVSFDAVVSEDAEPGQIAYNSFAYNYEVKGIPLESSPLIVGTRIQDYPYLQKVLVDKNGSSYTAEKDLTFRFLVFKGDKSLISGVRDADLQTYLEQNNISNHVFDVTVSEGQSSSSQVRLSPTDNWEWEDQEQYTVVEIPSEGEYRFNRWKNGGSDAITFTYNVSRKQVFTAENANIVWEMHLLKVDAEESQTPLEGAVFARYSINILDAITDEAYNTVTSNYGLNPVRSYEEKDSHGSLLHTWYLADVKETGPDGAIDWADLVEDEYELVEIKAPDGYTMREKPYRVTRHDSVDGQGRVLVVLKNEKSYELPYTGGIGRLPFVLTGLFLIMVSALTHGFRMRRRERRIN